MSEQPKWTPRPWHDDGCRIYAPTDDPDKRNGRVIVEYKHVPDFNPADGPLIAAAPELYAILLDMTDRWDNPFEPDNQHPLYLKARAALAKARGEA